MSVIYSTSRINYVETQCKKIMVTQKHHNVFCTVLSRSRWACVNVALRCRSCSACGEGRGTWKHVVRPRDAGLGRITGIIIQLLCEGLSNSMNRCYAVRNHRQYQVQLRCIRAGMVLGQVEDASHLFLRWELLIGPVTIARQCLACTTCPTGDKVGQQKPRADRHKDSNIRLLGFQGPQCELYKSQVPKS